MKTKRFKQTDIGPIPEDWEVVSVGGVCTDCCYGVGAEAVEYDGENRYIRITDIDDTTHAFRPSPLASPAFFDSKHVVAKGDILVARTGATVGKSYAYSEQDGKLIFAGFLLKVNVKGADQKYLFYKTLTGQYHNWVASESARSGQPGINLQQFKTFLFSAPPLPEQRRIAAALGDVDSLLATYDALIEKKRKIKVGAMQELLGIRNEELGMRNEPRRRLPGFTGAWVEKGFDECFSLLSNNTYAREFMCADETGVANIHYGDVLIRYGSVLDFSTTHVDSLVSSVIIISESLKDGDLIFADTAEDEMVGKAVEVRNLKDRRAVSGLHTVACRPKFEFAEGWLGYYINSPDYHNQLLPLITGTKVSSVSKAGFRQTVLHFPPTVAEQRAIAGVLSDMDAEIAELEREREKTRRIREGMMQELLTGRVRLEVA